MSFAMISPKRRLEYLLGCWNKKSQFIVFFSFHFGIPQTWEASIVFGILSHDAMENDDYQRAYAGTRAMAMNNQTKYIRP